MRQRKGQTSTELIIIIGAGLLIITGVIIVMENMLVSAKLANHKDSAKEIFTYIKEELASAEGSPYTYNSSFYIPTNIKSGARINDITLHNSGFSYTPADITLTIEEIQYVNYFYNISDTSTICIGKNELYKQKGSQLILITCKN